MSSAASLESGDKSLSHARENELKTKAMAKFSEKGKEKTQNEEPSKSTKEEKSRRRHRSEVLEHHHYFHGERPSTSNRTHRDGPPRKGTKTKKVTHTTTVTTPRGWSVEVKKTEEVLQKKHHRKHRDEEKKHSTSGKKEKSRSHHERSDLDSETSGSDTETIKAGSRSKESNHDGDNDIDQLSERMSRKLDVSDSGDDSAPEPSQNKSARSQSPSAASLDNKSRTVKSHKSESIRTPIGNASTRSRDLSSRSSTVSNSTTKSLSNNGQPPRAESWNQKLAGEIIDLQGAVEQEIHDQYGNPVSKAEAAYLKKNLSDKSSLEGGKTPSHTPVSSGGLSLTQKKLNTYAPDRTPHKGGKSGEHHRRTKEDNQSQTASSYAPSNDASSGYASSTSAQSRPRKEEQPYAYEDPESKHYIHPYSKTVSLKSGSSASRGRKSHKHRKDSN